MEDVSYEGWSQGIKHGLGQGQARVLSSELSLGLL